MKHNYSNADIRRATVYEGLDVHAADIRLILNALPEPVSDDWQECRFEDIQKGDRVRLEKHSGDFEEFTVGSVDKYSANAAKSNYCVSKSSTGTLYRIPAPVQHPDPAEHPVIYVKDCDIVGFIPKIMVWYRDSYVAGRQCVSPERITDWQQIDPAKVVEDDR